MTDTTDDLVEKIKADRKAGTPGPWTGHNMIHEDGRAMTPDEIGEYVSNSVRMGIDGRFLFISGKHADGGDCDVCHTGNGPRGEANTRRIARVPDMEDRILSDAETIKAAKELAAVVNCAIGKADDGKAKEALDMLSSAKLEIKRFNTALEKNDG